MDNDGDLSRVSDSLADLVERVRHFQNRLLALLLRGMFIVERSA
jgi:hypothetical protein